eukprot:TRINITY_DN4212_c0_g2_i2.p3 TRINITY_DN4212_c0_g2~~TRINITY_DN4212_c0_g2_i2.p3  ORF type:complete len:248 (+),score=-27.10 TRINITY_DN4212_c0_g2_i2:136-879(+)
MLKISPFFRNVWYFLCQEIVVRFSSQYVLLCRKFRAFFFVVKYFVQIMYVYAWGNFLQCNIFCVLCMYLLNCIYNMQYIVYVTYWIYAKLVLQIFTLILKGLCTGKLKLFCFYCGILAFIFFYLVEFEIFFSFLGIFPSSVQFSCKILIAYAFRQLLVTFFMRGYYIILKILLLLLRISKIFLDDKIREYLYMYYRGKIQIYFYIFYKAKSIIYVQFFRCFRFVKYSGNEIYYNNNYYIYYLRMFLI